MLVKQELSRAVTLQSTANSLLMVGNLGKMAPTFRYSFHLFL